MPTFPIAEALIGSFFFKQEESLEQWRYKKHT